MSNDVLSTEHLVQLNSTLNTLCGRTATVARCINQRALSPRFGFFLRLSVGVTVEFPILLVLGLAWPGLAFLLRGRRIHGSIDCQLS